MSTCVGCERPMPDDQAYGCVQCAQELADALRKAAGHAEDAWTVIARQTRVGSAGGASRPEPEPSQAEEDLRRNPVTAFGWQASIERPAAGGLRPGAGPADLAAFDRLRAVENTLTTWARLLAEERDSSSRVWTDNPVREAALTLAGHVDEIRRHPAADEAFDELHDACRQMERLVDRPADRELVGMCDCGRVLYAAQGKTAVTCPTTTCGLHWNVERSREILRTALDDKLVTAGEAARLGQYLDTDRTQEQIRKLINSWASRGELTPHPLTQQLDDDDDDEAEAAYRFGEVAGRLARTPRRTRRGVAA